MLPVFLYGGSSILQKLATSNLELATITTYAALTTTLVLLLLPLKLIDYINRFLFVTLAFVVVVLIAGLATKIDWHDLCLVMVGL